MVYTVRRWTLRPNQRLKPVQLTLTLMRLSPFLLGLRLQHALVLLARLMVQPSAFLASLMLALMVGGKLGVEIQLPGLRIQLNRHQSAPKGRGATVTDHLPLDPTAAVLLVALQRVLTTALARRAVTMVLSLLLQHVAERAPTIRTALQKSRVRAKSRPHVAPLVSPNAPLMRLAPLTERPPSTTQTRSVITPGTSTKLSSTR